MAPVTVTEAEVLAALAEALGPRGAEDAFTRDEMQAALGWGKDRCLATLATLAKAGAVEVTSVVRTKLTGLPQKKPGYRFVR